MLRKYAQNRCNIYESEQVRLPVNAKIIEAAKNLKVIVTASTGLVHADLESAKSKGVKVISLTQEYETINRISSTAEHALALTLLSVRNLFWAITDVQRKQWDYEKFVGRQINALTVGVMGYGRLGKMYARYIDALVLKCCYMILSYLEKYLQMVSG